ncbi:MAG: O-antigen ligase family protein [Desulfobulbaceae bacterium]|nr:O-antigen ligase family protein [Desulfobulbaceae bacterium]
MIENLRPFMVLADNKQYIPLWLYFVIFTVGLLPPFAGIYGQIVGLAFLILIMIRLCLLTFKRQQTTYNFMFIIGLLGTGQIYFRDFALKGLPGYLLIEYIFIILGVLNFHLVLRTFGTRRFGTRLWPFLFYSFWALLTLAYSLDPLKGRWFIALYLSGIAIITLVLCADNEDTQNGVLDGLVLGAVLVLGVTLASYIQTPQVFLEETEFRFGHYLTSAVQLGTILAMGGIIWFSRNFYNNWYQQPSMLVPLCLMGASVITMSRTSSLALFLSFICLFAWKQSLKKLMRAVIMLSAITAALAMVALAYQSDVAKDRFLEPTKKESRFDIWRVAVEMAKDEPLGGFGVGSWSQIYPQYASNYGGVHAKISDAHNILVQALAECGVIGLILLGTFFLVLLPPALKAKDGIALSMLVFVVTISMTGSLKLVAPYFLFGLTILFSPSQRSFQKP